jgi:hypothetical protein
MAEGEEVKRPPQVDPDPRYATPPWRRERTAGIDPRKGR